MSSPSAHSQRALARWAVFVLLLTVLAGGSARFESQSGRAGASGAPATHVVLPAVVHLAPHVAITSNSTKAPALPAAMLAASLALAVLGAAIARTQLGSTAPGRRGSRLRPARAPPADVVSAARIA